MDHDIIQYACLLENVEKALVSNRDTDIYKTLDDLSNVINDIDVGRETKLLILSHVAERCPLRPEDKQCVNLDSRRVKNAFIYRSYYSLFDETNFRANRQILRYFFESATRMGRERDRLLAYCADVVQQLNYADLQILLDIIPVCDTKQRVKVRMNMLEPPQNVFNNRPYYYKRPCYYTDRQSVHFTGVAESVNSIMNTLDRDVSHKFYGYLDSFRNGLVAPLTSRQDTALSIIRHDSSTLKLKSVFCLVWEEIDKSEHKTELISRLLQELDEMSGTCCSGHASRLINVLTGFSDTIRIGVNYKEEIAGTVLARFNRALQKFSEEDQEIYLIELMKSKTDRSDAFTKIKLQIIDSIDHQIRSEYEPLLSDRFTRENLDSMLTDSYDGM